MLDNLGKNLIHKGCSTNTIEMFTRRAQPIRVIRDPHNQWISTAIEIPSASLSTRKHLSRRGKSMKTESYVVTAAQVMFGVLSWDKF
jgi:hypothetical protein